MRPSEYDKKYSEYSEYDKTYGSKLDLECWSMLLGHLTGFASINAWGSVQQCSIFKSDPFMTMLVLPIAMVGGLCIQRITYSVRQYLVKRDGKVSKKEKEWNEAAEECEDDVVGLTLSFNVVQSIRYVLTHQLPNLEGAWGLETMDTILKGSPWTTLVQIYVVALISAAAVFVMIQMGFVENEEKATDKEGKKTEKETDEKTTCERIKERSCNKVVITLSMVHAWCAFYSGQLLLAKYRPRPCEDQERSSGHLEDKKTTCEEHGGATLLALLLAFFLTAASFVVIWILDFIADRVERKNKTTKYGLKRVILAVGVAVGFSWEQCFDQAIDSIASWAHPHVQLTKSILALLCVGILVPAYKRFFLPMLFHKGYRHGFVVEQLGNRGATELVHVTRSVAEVLTERFTKFDSITRVPNRRQGCFRAETERSDEKDLKKQKDLKKLEEAGEAISSLHEALQKAIKKEKGYSPPPRND